MAVKALQTWDNNIYKVQYNCQCPTSMLWKLLKRWTKYQFLVISILVLIKTISQVNVSSNLENIQTIYKLPVIWEVRILNVYISIGEQIVCVSRTYKWELAIFVDWVPLNTPEYNTTCVKYFQTLNTVFNIVWYNQILMY